MLPAYRKIFYFGLIVYAVLLIFSIVFYKERATFTDASYFLYSIVKNSSVTIQNYRFIAVVPQIFPLLAVKMSLSLDAVMLSYSMAFILYYCACYLICGFVLKDYKHAIAILLLNLLFATHTFYWMVSELQLGLAFLILMFAILQHSSVNRSLLLSCLVFVVGLIVVIFAHPLMIFPVSFTLFFLLLHDRTKHNRLILLIGLITFAVVYWVKSRYYTSPDDAARLDVKNVLLDRYHNVFDIQKVKLFIKKFIWIYYWLPICGGLMFIYYLLRQYWLKMLLFTGYVVGFTLLIYIMYYNDYTPDFYIENLYLPAAFFVLLPLVHDGIPWLSGRKLAGAFLALVFVTGLIRIYFAHRSYTDRLVWQEEFLKQNIDRKLLLAESMVPMDKLIFSWASPYDFWLLSTSVYHKTASIMVSDKIESVRFAAMFDRNSFITQWGAIPYDSLPPRYFILKDTFTTYTIVE